MYRYVSYKLWRKKTGTSVSDPIHRIIHIRCTTYAYTSRTRDRNIPPAGWILRKNSITALIYVLYIFCFFKDKHDIIPSDIYLVPHDSGTSTSTMPDIIRTRPQISARYLMSRDASCLVHIYISYQVPGMI